jgi:hypothetical protein
MAMYFHRVFSGIAVRLAHYRQKAFIDRLALIIDNPAQNHLVSVELVQSAVFYPGLKNGPYFGNGLTAADPDNGNAAFTWRGGNSRYGFLLHLSKTSLTRFGVDYKYLTRLNTALHKGPGCCSRIIMAFSRQCRETLRSECGLKWHKKKARNKGLYSFTF